MKKDRWESLVNRLKQEARTVLRNNRSDGIAIIRANIVVSSEGEVLLWVVPQGRRVEPSGDAAKILKHLTQVS